MATFKEVLTSKKYIPFKGMKTGETIIDGSKYVGRSPNKFGKENFEFEDDLGLVSVLNHCGALEYKMEKVSVGTKVKIVYKGRDKLEKGPYAGKEFHDFSVFVDTDSATTEVTPTAEESQPDLLGL